MKMDIHKKMHQGELYFCTDEALMEEQTRGMELLYDYNNTRPSQGTERTKILKEMLAECGEGCYVEPPFHASWGKHTHFGNDIYANFNLTVVDDTHIYVGDRVKFGPNVTISTAGHPVEPTLRKEVAQFNMPVHIGDNVWIGAGVIILPGITIGENTVIGAGSIVTKNIPANVVAVGNPCRILREIGEHDQTYYYKDKKIDVSKAYD